MPTKTLLILRHGKATKNEPVGDYDRALTARGRRDAVSVGAYLRNHAIVPDLIVTSSANRTRITAQLVAEAAGYAGETIAVRALYLAELEDLLDCIHTLPDDRQRVLLVGHNFGLEYLVHSLTRHETVIQTAGLAQVECEAESWALFGSNEICRLRRYYCPDGEYG